MQMELPIAAMVHSGGKSIHAVIHINADSYKQYMERVDYLYDVCKRNGFKPDTQMRNPSRLSRMPGIKRNDKRQYLIHTNVGKSTWEEWREWVEDINDDLPDIEELKLTDDEPELAPELIQGLLREGHKLLLAGPSKAGKSFALMQLCASVDTGTPWLGWQVKKGRVLYVNLELDSLSSKHRFWKIRQALNLKYCGNIDVWNLRGNATSLDKLTPKLIRRAQKKQYTVVVIDPIYKVLTGDENSASEMAAFCNQFDKICHELGAATVCCHHHSKGAQGQKKSNDRSSGSGVFARDPDAILDLIELNLDQAMRDTIINRHECAEMGAALDVVRPGWRDECSQDDAIVGDALFDWAKSIGQESAVREVRPSAREVAQQISGWRVEGTLREFPAFRPRNVFFRYPVHVLDTDGLLKSAKAEGEEPPWATKQKSAKEKAQDKRDAFESAVDICMGFDKKPVSKHEVAEHMAVSPTTVERRVKASKNYVLAGGLIYSKGTEPKGNDDE
jgi:RecA-family ATPase